MLRSGSVVNKTAASTVFNTARKHTAQLRYRSFLYLGYPTSRPPVIYLPWALESLNPLFFVSLFANISFFPPSSHPNVARKVKAN